MFSQTPPKAGSRPASPGGTTRRQKQTAPAFDYLPLKAGARYTYSGVYQRLDTGASVRDVFTLVTKTVIKDGTEVFYFVEEEKGNSTVQMLDVNMIGLGAYAKGPDGISTYDCPWNQDLAKIPPKKPTLFLRSSLRIGDTLKVMSDDRSNAYEYTVLAFENLTVPAGQFQDALKLGIRMLYASGGSEESTAWFGRGVGLIKRIRSTGRVEELLSYEKPAPAGAFITRSINEWVGLKFIFLPQRKMFQKYGYQMLHKPGEPRKSLPYDQYKNRTATVTKVTPFEYGHYLELVLDGSRGKVIAEAYADTVTALGPLDDL